MSEDPVRVAFVRVRNAGWSRMAHAFAERERDRRDAGDREELLTGGTRPADAVHDVVVEAMAERGVDVGDRTPTRGRHDLRTTQLLRPRTPASRA